MLLLHQLFIYHIGFENFEMVEKCPHPQLVTN